MCLILDTNVLTKFLNPKDRDMQPIRDWLSKSGKIVYSPTKKFEQEYKRVSKIKQKMIEYKKAGKLKLIPKQDVEKEEKRLNTERRRLNLRSNDLHILALALVSNVKLLASKDKKLFEDFTAPNIVGGRIYKTMKNKNLLRKDTCP